MIGRNKRVPLSSGFFVTRSNFFWKLSLILLYFQARCFTPLKERNFWLHVFRRNGTGRSVSVFRNSRVLVSDNLSNRHARCEGTSSFIHLCTIFNVPVTIKSFTVRQHSCLLLSIEYCCHVQQYERLFA